MPGLTRAQTIYPGTPPQFYGSTDDAMAVLNQALAEERRRRESAPLNITPPQVTGVTDQEAPGVGPVSVEGQAPQPVSLPPQIQYSGGSAVPAPTPSPRLPFVVPKPTFEQATKDSNGLPVPINSSETKLGKFLHILVSAAKGGLAGEASSEQALAQSGGRRNGGPGLGFEAAQQDATIKPVQEALAKNNLENQQVETQQRRALLPWILRNQQLNQQETQARISLQAAQTEANNALANKRDLSDEDKINAKAAIAQKHGIAEGSPEWKDFVLGIKDNGSDSLLKEWRSQNPDAPVSDFMDLQEKLKHKYDKGFKPNATQATPGEFGHIEEKKNDALTKLQSQFRFNEDSGAFEKKDNSGNVSASFTPQEWRDQLQNVQNAYEGNIKAAGGTVQHFEYPAVDTGSSQQTAPASQVSQHAAAKQESTAAPDKTQATRVLKNKQGHMAYLIGQQWYVDKGKGLEQSK